jgi:predicted XRE-type DNA-binding protein
MCAIATKNHDLILIRSLIELKGLSISKAAELMNIQRTNLSSWLNGKPNVFSSKKIEGMLDSLDMRAMGDASTGGALRYLSPNIVHLWHLEKDSHSLIDVLRSTESDSSLQWMEIFQVDAHPKGRFNLMRRKSASGDLIILIANKDSTSETYPVLAENIGFGKNAGRIKVPLEKWIGWWKTKTLPASSLREELESLTGTEKISEAVDNELTTYELDITKNKLKESICNSVGFRAIIRAFRGEMEKIDPDNKLLKKEVRDKIFNEYYNKEAQSLGVKAIALSAKNN